jgi:hypothetical protein
VLDDLGREAMAAVAERRHVDILPDTPLAPDPGFRDNATWTDDNLLRQVVYEGLREDKPAREVRRNMTENLTTNFRD